MEKRNIDRNEKASQLLLSQLISIQKKQGFLSEERLKTLSKEMNIPMTKIYDVASFYSFLHTKQVGKHIIRLCNSPSCYLNGSENILKSIESLLKIKPGETTKDGKFTLEFTSCIGCCDEGPAALIDGKAYTQLDEKKIKEIIAKCK